MGLEWLKVFSMHWNSAPEPKGIGKWCQIFLENKGQCLLLQLEN